MLAASYLVLLVPTAAGVTYVLHSGNGASSRKHPTEVAAAHRHPLRAETLRLVSVIGQPVRSMGTDGTGLGIEPGSTEARRLPGSIFTALVPRHDVASRNGRFLYSTLGESGEVVKVLRHSGAVAGVVHTGSDCRSIAISPNGSTLYVGNYLSNTVTVLRSDNLRTAQVVSTGGHPAAVTFNPVTSRVWVTLSTGEILIYAIS